MQQRETHNHPAFPILLLMFLIPLILLFIFFNVADASFTSLGLSGNGAALLLFASLAGSTINIPLTRRRIELVDPVLASLSPMLRQIAKSFTTTRRRWSRRYWRSMWAAR